MYTDASLSLRPQTHLVFFSGSGFDGCNDVFLDSYNEPEANLDAWYSAAPNL